MLRARPLRGLGLVELIVGIALMGGAVAVVLGLFPIAQSSLTQSRDTIAAIYLARQVLDRARATPFFALRGVSGAVVEIHSQFQGDSDTQRFFYDLSLAPSSVPSQAYVDACVTVRWAEAGNLAVNHSIHLDTVIPNR